MVTVSNDAANVPSMRARVHHAQRQAAPGHPFAPDTPWQAEMEDAFGFTESSTVAPGNEPVVDEYLRRQTLSAEYYKSFVAELKKRGRFEQDVYEEFQAELPPMQIAR